MESLKAGKALELVAHSQGGIITANALVLARNDPRFAAMTDTQWLEATKNISVVCFGTPQRVFNVSKVTSYVHDNDPVVSAVNGLRSIPAVAKIAGYIKGVVREKLPIISSPELKPEVVVLGGKNGGSHEFALYLEDLPKFRAQQILARAKGNGEKACDIIVELAERGAASNDQIERTALETFGSVGPKDPTQFQQEFARRFIQYQKQDRINGKHWSQSTQELFYHAQGAAYPWEKPSRLVPKGTRVADLRRQFANPENIDSGIGQSDDERYESDPSLIYNRRNSSAAIAAAAVGHSHAAEDESRRRNDNASSEARMAAQSGMAGVPAQHSDAVNANREHHETVASAPSALTDERSRDFQGQLAERRAVDERSTSTANAEAKQKTEKQAEGARDAAAERVASKEKAERDRKADDDARAADSQRAGETEARVAAAERTAVEAKEEADRASKKATAADQKKAPVTRIYNRVTTIIQNFFGREAIPPPPPQEGPVILP